MNFWTIFLWKITYSKLKTLKIACRTGDLARVQELLTGHGSSINARDINGRRSTPLHFAAGFGRKEVFNLLLRI